MIVDLSAGGSSDHGSYTASQVTLEMPILESSQVFERSFRLLQKYKKTYGTTVLSTAHCQGEYILRLRKFVSYWRGRAKRAK
jgi:hypothetical protein